MLLLGSAHALLLLLLLLLCSSRGFSQPEGERTREAHRQELGDVQEDLLLKLLSVWADSAESRSLEMDRGVPDALETRFMRPPQHLPLRQRKAPCKNFFWKTFTMC